MTFTEARERLPEGWTLMQDWMPGTVHTGYWCVPDDERLPDTRMYADRSDAVDAALRLDLHFQREGPPPPQGELFE